MKRLDMIKSHTGGGAKLALHKGFTLAEAFITLGIIGIVAALTMPALVANHRKKVTETRLKKFYSVLMQTVAINQADGNSIEAAWDGTADADDPDKALEFFNKHYEPYMKTTEVKKLSHGVAAGFPDGSGMYLRLGNVSTYTHAVINFCVDYKVCKTDLHMFDTSDQVYADGKKLFRFYADRAPTNEGQDRNGLIYYCGTYRKDAELVIQRRLCTALIAEDGWEIKDDYPW